MDTAAAVEAVKRLVRAQSVRIVWPQPGIMDAIKEAEEAKKAVDALPSLPAASHPNYPSVADDQCGFVIATHLTDDQMGSIPLHIAREMLDSLASSAGGVSWQSPPEKQREQLLASYGQGLADLICQGIDEALESRDEGHKRLRDYDGKRFASLDSQDLDEPLYEDCAPDAEFASPCTSFDFWGAIEAARELIEERDKAAAAARYGLAA